MPALREAIGSYLAERFALHYDAADEILVTVGGSEAIDLAIRCLVGPGDEGWCPRPRLCATGRWATVCGGVVKELVTTEKTGFSDGAADRCSADRAHQAAGAPISQQPYRRDSEESDLRAIADVLRGTNVIVLCDEIYGELTMAGATVPLPPRRICGSAHWWWAAFRRLCWRSAGAWDICAAQGNW